MDTLPLPPKPRLDQYRKRAKGLVAAAESSNPDAIRGWARDWLETLARLRGVVITPFVQHSFDRAIETIEARMRERVEAARRSGSTLNLAQAQFLIARAHGFESWPKFASHVERIARADAEVGPFEAAADAVVTGDLATLESLVRQTPGLIGARSTREHEATLLHYVAANGVEDFRQKTPPNAVDVARFLLEQGAAVDVLANTYGGGKAQTTMNLLVSSTHPAEAGLQEALVEVLLDFGAAINGLEDDMSPVMTALAFSYIGAAETLARRGARIDNIVAAAALGRLDLVRQFLAEGDRVKSSLVGLYWVHVPDDPKARVEQGLIYACAYGRTPVVEYLLGQGVDPAAKDGNGMTCLHCAAAGRHIEIVNLLVKRGAPLEAKNTWGGTVLDSTVYFALNQPTRGPASAAQPDYATVLEALIAAGADVRAVDFPTGDRLVDDVLQRHRG